MRRLCRLAEIPDGEGRGFLLDVVEAEELTGGDRDIFVVRRGDEVFGYVNVCPHTGTPLDWVEDQFMTLDKHRIMCATHGAEFEIRNGRCIAGPCLGESLRRLDVVIRDGAVILRSAPSSGLLRQQE